MNKVIILVAFTIITLSGLLQFFLIPGLIWNFLFPIAPVLLILSFLFSSVLRRVRYLKIYTTLLIALMIFEIGFNIYTSTHIKSPETAKELTIMSYNLFFKNRNKTNSIALIKKQNPDLLLVQELTPEWHTTLNQALKKSHPYQLTHALNGTHGIGIYSKYKLSDHKLLKNANKLPFAQTGVVDINHKKIQIINTHLASPAIAIENPDQFFKLYAKNYQERKTQVNQLCQLAKDHSDNYNAQLLIGDLNTLIYEPIFKTLRLDWVNAFPNHLSLNSRNFPNSSKIPPLIMLDYIMGRGLLKFKTTKIIEGGSSDHLAILARVEI